MDVEIEPTKLSTIKIIRDSDYILISYMRFSYKVLASEFFNFIKNYISTSSGKVKLLYDTPRLSSLDKILNSSISIQIESQSKLPVTYKWFFNGSPILENQTGIYEIQNLTEDHFGNYFVIAENENGFAVSKVLTFTK
jgi:hypothetical protein